MIVAPGLDAGPLTSRFAHDVVLLASSALILVKALSAGRERLAWLLIGGGVLAWSLGELHYTVFLWDAEVIAIPSLADIGYLLLPPLALAGIVLLLRARARAVPRTLWVDGVIAALAVAALSAAIVFQTVLDNVEGNAAAVATNLAYPLGDLVLLSLIVGALAGTGWRLDRTWMLLAIGVSTFWLADSLYLVKTAEGTFTSGGPIDTGWWAGLFLIAAAAWQTPPARVRAPQGESLRLIAVPLGFGLVGLALLVYGCIEHVNPLAIALAAASLVAVMIRLTLTFRENVEMLRASRDEAMTDALTGLGNRRALAAAIADLLPDGEEADEPATPLVLALFDLDGFKHYNDTFGHPAGDALLVRLGSNLAACLAAARQGLPDGRRRVLRADPAGRRRSRAARALRRRGAVGDRRGLHDRLLLRLDPAARGGLRPGRGAAHRRPAHVRPEARRPDVGRAPEQGRAADRAHRAQPRPGRAPLERRRAGRAHRAPARAVRRGGRARPPRGRAARRRQGRDPRRHPLQARPAQRGRVGLRAPPPADRRADRALRAVAEPRRRARALHPRALRRHGLPGPPGGRRDPARLPHRRRLRRVRRDDLPATLRGAAHAEEALDELRSCAGTQFDPAVVETFRAVVAERSLRAVA